MHSAIAALVSLIFWLPVAFADHSSFLNQAAGSNSSHVAGLHDENSSANLAASSTSVLIALLLVAFAMRS